ncbi:hypothetical protein CDD80_1605 [Ophiocordyceps camponoti-rufipedis]|uniref:Protein kinase domain-containing protein n=1 Tax=Ophiocordyceps camponoti-rufipedis TaxID=2004952 RepID=A0A2C5Z8I9_9HYPO|nr:hypothetical protein CDD80_1605 [Ophiocordyceps camponoti-rufipedis]
MESVDSSSTMESVDSFMLPPDPQKWANLQPPKPQIASMFSSMEPIDSFMLPPDPQKWTNLQPPKLQIISTTPPIESVDPFFLPPDPEMLAKFAPPERPKIPSGRLEFRKPYDRNENPKDVKTVKFRFRTRSFTATATVNSATHPNVMHLNLLPSGTQRLVQTTLRLLPPRLRDWFDTRYPEWNLPSRLVLKKYKKGWDEEFDTEISTYELVKPLQGIVVPHCYGELEFEGVRALLLSDVGGHNAATPEGSLSSVADFRRMLHTAFVALARFYVRHDDLKPDNFQVVGDKIMALDLEQVDLQHLSEEAMTRNLKSAADFVTDSYMDNQYFFWKRGYIAVV